MTPSGTLLRRTFEVDVSAQVPFAPGSTVAGWIVADPARINLPGVPVWCCSPGGGWSSQYFDLSVPGHARYSMAEDLAAKGGVVVGVDHLGTGRSSRVPDPFLLTPALIAETDGVAFRSALRMLSDQSIISPGVAVLIGVGHSMGGLLTVLQQAAHGTYDGLALLGHGGDGLPALVRDRTWLVKSAAAQRRELVSQARSQYRSRLPSEHAGPPRARPVYHGPEVPEAVLATCRMAQTPLLPACGLASMTPSFTDEEKRAVTAPVFLAFGSDDLTEDPTAAPRHYPRSRSVTLVMLEGSGHNHNQSGARRELWSQMQRWATSVIPERTA